MSWALVGLSVAASPAVGQEMSFRELPDTACREPARWRRVMTRGFYTAMHGVILGDSQETCPQGHGDAYVPALNAGFARHYGGCGMTPWCQAGQSFGGGNPWGEWLVRGGAAPPGLTTLTATPPWLAPGLRLAVTSSIEGHNANHDQRFGWLLTLDPRAEWSHPEAGVLAPAESPWFDASGGVELEVFGVASPGSSELRVVFSYVTGEPSYYGTITGVGTTRMGLDGPTGQIRSQTFGPLRAPPGAKIQAEIFGTDRSRTANVLTARFISDAAPRGLVLTDLAEGGYQASDVLRRHSDCGPMLGAMRPDVVFLTYGANEVRNGSPLTTYRRSLETLIRYVRENTSPETPVVVMPDVFQRVLDPYNEKTMNDLSSVGHEIALENPAVLFVNSRKLTDAVGWDETDGWRFLSDSVHYTPLGGRTKAELEAAAILGRFGCPADVNDDGFLDFFDFDLFNADFEVGGPEGDFNVDGFLDFFDYNDFVEAFERGC